MWPRRFARIGAAVAVLYVGDKWLNDDLDGITRRFRRKLPAEEQEHRPRVVILGSGWGALSLLRKLNTDRFRVTVVSPRNHFVFTPLLPSAATGNNSPTLSPLRRHHSDRAETFAHPHTSSGSGRCC